MRRRPLRALAVLFCALLAAAPAFATDPPQRAGLFVMGIDGMDPVIVERMMREGRLPNFVRLAQEGSFQELGTSNPPQSPVAWSEFVTGLDPGGHGIFDFVHRDPKTYHPISSATPAVEDPGSTLDFFGYKIPYGQPEPANNRGGTPWWDLLAAHGVPVEVYRIPGNFPTPPSDASVLSGMGTVDLRGGYGTYTLYTTEPPAAANPKGDIELVTLHDLDLDGAPDTARGELRGPPDQFHLEAGQIPDPGAHLALGLTIHLAPETDTALLEIGDAQVLLKEGEWSEWVEVEYEALPLGLANVSGTVRFYAKELRPRLQLYASPVNISPADPAMPISSPDDFATTLHDELGFYYTQGMPEDTSALKDGVFDDDDYRQQVKLVQQDNRRMIARALDHFAPGAAAFVYLSDIDLQCHMLWRHGDPKYPGAPPHPAFEARSAERHAQDIENYYRDVDAELGEIRRRLPPETLLIVMSDHGFQPFERELHLNAWLRDEGYLTLKDGKRTGQIVRDDVDWSKTRAYGIGFNGLYLNRAGRESEGIVGESEAAALLQEISEKLLAYRDPERGRAAVLRVDRADAVYAAARRAEGPDLIIGYDQGYGASDESTLGEITEDVIRDNTSRWSGNHLMAPEVVPGILLLNRKLARDGHDLRDLTATILAHYGIAAPAEMTGTPIFQ